MTPSEKILQTAIQWSEGEITDAEFVRHVEADVTAAVAAEREACASRLQSTAARYDEDLSATWGYRAIAEHLRDEAREIQARGATNGK